MKTQLNIKNTQGLSLVELMIAMAISAILMIGISQIFSSNKRSYNVQDESARMQESGRYAFNTLMQDIRRAGYFGGNAQTSAITGSVGIAPPARNCLTGNTSWGRMIERPIYGLNDGNTDIDADALAVDYTGCIPNADYLRGDILVSRYTKSTNIPTATMAANPNRLYIRNSLFSGFLFLGSEDAANLVSETPNGVHELAASAYYVGPSGRSCRFNDAGNNPIPIPALQREVLSSTGIPEREEVANGVEYIQFQYGADSNGDLSVNRYYDANDFSNMESVSPNWTQVVTVRLWVLVRADCPTNNYVNSQTYVMGDANYGPMNDGFKRQLYSTTVAVRN